MDFEMSTKMSKFIMILSVNIFGRENGDDYL